MGTEKSRRKAVEALGPLLPPGVAVRAYAAGRANARMTPRVTYVIVGFLLLLVVVAVLTERILFPGVLVFAFFISAITPQRGIAVVDDGVVVLSTGAMTGRPKSILGELPHAVLFPPHIRRSGARAILVPLGPDVVRLRADAYERLTASVGVTAPGWYPLDGDQYRQRYWSGTTWTSMKRWDGTAWVDAEPSRH